MKRSRLTSIALAASAVTFGCKAAAPQPPPAPTAPAEPAWKLANPLAPLPKPPLGSHADFATLSFRVTPEKVRLGRWLFYDPRLSADGTISCASCHAPGDA